MRSEYLRSRLTREVKVPDGDVSVDGLSWFTDAFADLGNPDVMRRAWE